jgi:hypothetical protein
MEIFTKGFDKGFVTSPELGDPLDGNFIHNVHATQTRKENVDKLCLAETNLNIFWAYVDDNLSRLATDWLKVSALGCPTLHLIFHPIYLPLAYRG